MSVWTSRKEGKNLGSGKIEARKSQGITWWWQRAFFFYFEIILFCYALRGVCHLQQFLYHQFLFVCFVLFIFGLLHHLFYIFSFGCAGSSLLYRLSVVAVHGLLTVAASIIVIPGLQADSRTQYLWFRGLVVPWPVRWWTGLVLLWQVRSSRTENQTGVPCIGRRILNHWTTRVIPGKELGMLAGKLFPGTIWLPFSSRVWWGPVCMWLLQVTPLLASCKCVAGGFFCIKKKCR